MIRNTLTILAAFTLALAAMSAQAQQPDYGRSGVYVGLAAGGGLENFDDEGLPIKFHNGFVGGGTIGYRAHPNVAIEAQLEYGRFNADVGSIDIDTDILTYTANAKGYLLTGQIQPYAMVGVGGMYAHAKAKSGGASATTSDSGFAARFGGGVDYWFTESISFGAAGSYVLPTGDLDGLDYFSLAGAIQFRF